MPVNATHACMHAFIHSMHARREQQRRRRRAERFTFCLFGRSTDFRLKQSGARQARRTKGSGIKGLGRHRQGENDGRKLHGCDSHRVDR